MTHKERNHIYFEEQCWFLTMSRASSFLRVFPSFRPCFVFPGGTWWEAGARPAPRPDPLGAAAPVWRLRVNWSIPVELSGAVWAAPGVRGLCPGCDEQGCAAPLGTTNPPDHGSARGAATCRCPESVCRWERAPGERGGVRRASSHGPPSPPAVFAAEATLFGG